MGAAKNEMMRREGCFDVTVEIHRLAGNVEDSYHYEPCDNGVQDMEEAYKIAAAMWRDKDSMVGCFVDRKELMDGVKTTLGELPSISIANENIFDAF
jgi:hypothetical protein